MAFLLVIEHEAVQKRLIKITLEYVGSSAEQYNGMTETGKKKITVSLLSNLGLSTARCEQIVHKGGQASVSAEVACASSNCLKHERRKKNGEHVQFCCGSSACARWWSNLIQHKGSRRPQTRL
jgi:hypothetical protein